MSFIIVAFTLLGSYNIYALEGFILVRLNLTESTVSTRYTRIVFSQGDGYTTGLNEGDDPGAFGGESL